MDKERDQPTTDDISKAILQFSGPVITQRAFKQLAPTRLRKVADEEFKRAAQELDIKFGTTVEVRVPRCVKKQIVFIKKDPEEIGWENVNPNLITKEMYTTKFQMSCHPLIGNGMRTYLVKEGLIDKEVLNQEITSTLPK